MPAVTREVTPRVTFEARDMVPLLTRSPVTVEGAKRELEDLRWSSFEGQRS